MLTRFESTNFRSWVISVSFTVPHFSWSLSMSRSHAFLNIIIPSALQIWTNLPWHFVVFMCTSNLMTQQATQKHYSLYKWSIVNQKYSSLYFYQDSEFTLPVYTCILYIELHFKELTLVDETKIKCKNAPQCG